MEIGEALRVLSESVDEFADADPLAPSERKLLGAAVELERVPRRLDAATVGVVDALDRTRAYREDGHSSATACVKHLGRLAGAEAATRVKGAAVLRRLPLFAKSYVEGRIPTGHLGVLGRVGANPRVAGLFDECDEWFRTQAIELDHEGFKLVVQQWEQLADADGAEAKSEREHLARNATVIKGFDGSFRTKANHGALQGALLSQVLDAFERAEFGADWAEARDRHGDAATKDDLGRTTAQVCRTTDGTLLTPGEVVAASMAGLVRAIVVDSKGNVINHGRAKRLFSGSSREAVLLREALKDPAGVRCGFASCEVPGWRCQIDHREPAARGGLTDHTNGDPACGFHNRLKETGFFPRLSPDGTYLICRPDGTSITEPA